MNAKPITDNRTWTWINTIVVALLGSACATMGLCLLTFTILIPLLNSQASQNWHEVPCKVLSSETSTKNLVDIRYEYEFNDHKYESTRYDFSNGNSRSPQSCQTIVREYLKKPSEICFVDPDNPHSSVIERDVDLQILPLIVGISFSLFGILIASLPILLRDDKRPASARFQSESSVVSSETTPLNNCSNHSADLEDKKLDSPQLLNPSSTRIGKLIRMIYLTLHCNGLLIFFAYLFGWTPLTAPAGIGAIFLTLVFVPFSLFGAVLVLGTFSRFLNLFSPKIEIATTTGAVMRGQSIDVAWEFEGKLNWIKRLRIAVVGTEEARYFLGGGDASRTVKSDFYSTLVADTTDQQNIAHGSASVRIPSDTMHTFSDEHHKIVWAFHVKADIRWWPNLREEFKFRVKP